MKRPRYGIGDREREVASAYMHVRFSYGPVVPKWIRLFRGALRAKHETHFIRNSVATGRSRERPVALGPPTRSPPPLFPSSPLFYLNLIILISRARSSFFLFVVAAIVESSSALGGSSRPRPSCSCQESRLFNFISYYPEIFYGALYMSGYKTYVLRNKYLDTKFSIIIE